jgi:phage baseplate assembly protein gpV
MPSPTIESAAREQSKPVRPETSIRTGNVVNNCDLLMQGKVLVRIPSLGQEVWARMAAIGAGPNTGFFHAPNIGDEVLVALDPNDPNHAFLLGGLWSTTGRPPTSIPTDQFTKRIFRTGLPKAPVAHQIELDDAKQSITITTSTEQKIALDPLKIELSTTGGQVSITLDMKTQSISLKGVKGIDLQAVGEINLKAAKVSINGTLQTDIKGGMVTIN